MKPMPDYIQKTRPNIQEQVNQVARTPQVQTYQRNGTNGTNGTNVIPARTSGGGCSTCGKSSFVNR